MFTVKKIEERLIKQLYGEWKNNLAAEFKKDYMSDLLEFMSKELDQGKVIYPQISNIFNAFKLTPLEQVKVVILGQDPYHGPGQAHGLSFSVKPGVKIPPSLKNIFKEIQLEYGCEIPTNGCLEAWTQQGVLLLNTVLTVEHGHAGSHQKKGWEKFTDKVVEVLNAKGKNLVFLLWGNPAQKKGKGIDQTRHLVLTSPHPSPLSVYRGFFGCNHFKQANAFLLKHNKKQIDWCIS